jgi:hypothetical protein
MNRSQQHASLRDQALEKLAAAALCLMGPPGTEDAFHAAVDDLPGLALERIETARDHLRRAETAIRKWIGDRREL